MSKNSKSIVFTNLIWRLAERCGAQLVAFVVSIVLARILDPDAYGTIALITVFTTILQVFVDSGLGNALIQKKDADDLDFATVFFTNVLFCAVLYLAIFLFAPLISSFYGRSEMTPYIRVLGLTVLISGIKNVQQAYVSRHMLFKRFFFSTLGGTITAGAAGIVMALSGFGVWALVAQQVINLAIDTTILWITVKWRPHKMFSFERLKRLFSFGWKLLASSLLDQGKKFPSLIITNVNASIDSVLLPAMSNVQDSMEHIRKMTRRAIKTSVYIMAPLMMGLVVTATPVIRLILTDKWLPCVPFLRIFCISYMFYPIHTANLNAIKAMGRSDLFLKLEIAKKVVGMVLLLSTMWFGVMPMAYSLLVSSLLSQIINSRPNRMLLKYGYIEQLKDILPAILLAVFMGVCVYPIQMIGLSNVITFIIQVVLGVVIYIGGSLVLKLDSFQYLWEIVKPVTLKILHRKAK